MKNFDQSDHKIPVGLVSQSYRKLWQTTDTFLPGMLANVSGTFHVILGPSTNTDWLFQIR